MILSRQFGWTVHNKTHPMILFCLALHFYLKNNGKTLIPKPFHTPHAQLTRSSRLPISRAVIRTLSNQMFQRRSMTLFDSPSGCHRSIKSLLLFVVIAKVNRIPLHSTNTTNYHPIVIDPYFKVKRFPPDQETFQPFYKNLHLTIARDWMIL